MRSREQSAKGPCSSAYGEYSTTEFDGFGTPHDHAMMDKNIIMTVFQHRTDSDGTAQDMSWSSGINEV